MKRHIFFRAALLAGLLALLHACSSGGGSDDDKDLFSLWTEKGGGSVLNLTGGDFNALIGLQLITVGMEVCNCELTITGNQSSGTYTVANCTYQPPTGGGVDPGCNAFNDTGSFTKSSDTLTLMPSSGSVVVYE